MDAKVEAAATAGASQLAAAGAAGATAAAHAGRFAGWNMHAKVRSGFCAVHAAVPTGRECVECRRSTEVGRWHDRVRPPTLVQLLPGRLEKSVRPIERAFQTSCASADAASTAHTRECPVVAPFGHRARGWQFHNKTVPQAWRTTHDSGHHYSSAMATTP